MKVNTRITIEVDALHALAVGQQLRAQAQDARTPPGVRDVLRTFGQDLVTAYVLEEARQADAAHAVERRAPAVRYTSHGAGRRAIERQAIPVVRDEDETEIAKAAAYSTAVTL